jgi:hypothetical protein
MEGQMVKLLPSLFLTLLMAGCAFMVEAEVYKIVDSTGKVIYTDTPPVDQSADELLLPTINQLPKSVTPESEFLAEDKPVFLGYSAVDLVAPQSDSIISYEQKNIIVQLALTPELQIGHLVQFYLDGAAYGRPVASTSYSIGDLHRGSHSVSARVITGEGEIMGSSRSVTVHVQRHFKRK